VIAAAERAKRAAGLPQHLAFDRFGADWPIEALPGDAFAICPESNWHRSAHVVRPPSPARRIMDGRIERDSSWHGCHATADVGTDRNGYDGVPRREHATNRDAESRMTVRHDRDAMRDAGMRGCVAQLLHRAGFDVADG
jgi:hypothetical protein